MTIASIEILILCATFLFGVTAGLILANFLSGNDKIEMPKEEPMVPPPAAGRAAYEAEIRSALRSPYAPKRKPSKAQP